jgi:hypothetical protein
VCRIRLAQCLNDRFFGLAVHLGDEIVRGFFLDGDDVKIPAGPVDDAGGAARGLDRDIEHWMHGGLL